MSVEEDVSGIYPSADDIGRDVAHLLRGAVTAFRCRDFLDRELYEAARIELRLLEQTLQAIDRAGLDANDDRLTMLRAAADKLRERLIGTVSRSA